MKKGFAIFSLFLFALVLSVPAFGDKTAKGVQYLKGIDENGNKVYGGKVPIETTYAFEQFVLSRRTERDKLEYLLSRLYQLQNYHFYWRGGRYAWPETYKGVQWVFHRWYKKNEDARSFLKDQFNFFGRPGEPLLIEFPNGAIHEAEAITSNELDLLEKTLDD